MLYTLSEPFSRDQCVTEKDFSLFEYGLLRREGVEAANSQAYIPHEDVHAMHS